LFATRLSALPGIFALSRLYDLDTGLVRKLTNRFGERETLHFLHETDGVARGFAPEAVVEAPLVVHVETRRFLLVKRAEADVTSPALL